MIVNLVPCAWWHSQLYNMSTSHHVVSWAWCGMERWFHSSLKSLKKLLKRSKIGSGACFSWTRYLLTINFFWRYVSHEVYCICRPWDFMYAPEYWVINLYLTLLQAFEDWCQISIIVRRCTLYQHICSGKSSASQNHTANLGLLVGIVLAELVRVV